MRISDWSLDVCSSDLAVRRRACPPCADARGRPLGLYRISVEDRDREDGRWRRVPEPPARRLQGGTATDSRLLAGPGEVACRGEDDAEGSRRSRRKSAEHTPELQSLMRKTYAVFCLKKKNKNNTQKKQDNNEKHK